MGGHLIPIRLYVGAKANVIGKRPFDQMYRQGSRGQKDSEGKRSWNREKGSGFMLG